VVDDGEQVPVRPRHICLLFKSMSMMRADTTASYKRAQEALAVTASYDETLAQFLQDSEPPEE
jgi:hypothetical protein